MDTCTGGKLRTDLKWNPFFFPLFHNCPRPFCYQKSQYYQVLPTCSPLSSSLPSLWSSGEVILNMNDVTYFHGKIFLMSLTWGGFSGGSDRDWFQGVWSLFPNPNILRRLHKYQEELRTFQAKSNACLNVLFPVYHSVKVLLKLLVMCIGFNMKSLVLLPYFLLWECTHMTMSWYS